MRSLGAMAPLRPRTEAGKKFGATMAAPNVVPARRKNFRRPITRFALIFKPKAYARPTRRVKADSLLVQQRRRFGKARVMFLRCFCPWLEQSVHGDGSRF